MSKVTDFKFCAAILRAACSARNVSFVDLPVQFDEENGFVGFRNGEIWAGYSSRLAATMANVIFVYLNNFEEIKGKPVFESVEQANTATMLVANFIRKLTNSVDTPPNDDLVAQRLYQYRIPWLLMHDLVCPAFMVPFRNHRVICHQAPQLDIAGCFEETGNSDDCALTAYVNTGIEYEPCSSAGLFLASLECHELDPAATVQEILESDLRDQLTGALKLAFKDDNEINDFIGFLLTFTLLDNKIESIVGKMPNILSGENPFIYKEAQHVRNFLNSSWWYFGLLEKMLESVRGSDWSTYKSLMPHLRETWDKIHEARRKQGRDGLNYEALLRVVNKESDEEPVILEALLGNNRVW